MTQDQIADIYQKANGWSPRAYPNTMAELEAFAKLVATKELEAVLDLVDAYAKNNHDLRDAIRARGQLQGDQKPG